MLKLRLRRRESRGQFAENLRMRVQRVARGAPLLIVNGWPLVAHRRVHQYPPRQGIADLRRLRSSLQRTCGRGLRGNGQQLLTGKQAQVWANDFIAVHLSEMPYHGPMTAWTCVVWATRRPSFSMSV